MELRNELRRLRELDIKEEQDRKKRLDQCKKEKIISKEVNDFQNLKNK